MTSGWFLENAWLIPLIPGVAFAVIILIGKRLPLKGAEVGVGLAMVLLVYRNRRSIALDELSEMKG